MEQHVINILSEIVGAQEDEIELDLDLFASGLLDSFAIIQLTMEIEEQYEVSIPIELLDREELSTPRKIVALIEKLL